MSSNNYAQNLLQSMSIIAEQAVKNANYDRTIQATIVSCVDPTIGKYKVNYQNGTWYAYSNNINTKYVKGSTVYILIPEGNMNNTKTILGTTKQLGINYISTVEEIEKYAVNGNSVITDSRTHNLCSYTKNEQGTINITSDLSINNNAAKIYFKKSSHFIASMLVRTNLPAQQRYNGNYGLNFYLNFANSTTGATVTRVYTFDIDSMQGNPYLYPNGMVQKTFFEIDGANFLGISKVQMFVKDFPNKSTEKPDDIFLSNISMYGAEALSEEELNGVALVLNAPKGYIFTSSNAASDTRTVNAQVRVLGKAIDNNSQKLPYYWFVQDCSITSKSLLYCKYGGQGWKCLNKYKKISDGRYEFNPAAATFSVKKQNVTIKQQKYKCVVIYENQAISKQFSIHNDGAKYDITISSDKGTEFVKDTGYPTLTCNVSTNESTSGFKYNWIETNSTGAFRTLSDETSEYNKYQTKLNNYNTLKNGFADGSKLKNDKYSSSDSTKNITKYNDLADELKILNVTQYVTKNKIIHLNVKNITNFSTFSCSVLDSNNNLIGTASITIVNKATSNGGYSLVINNGSQVFNYDENGISPCHTSQPEQLVIPALSFTLYDMKGEEVDQDNFKDSDVSWIVPTKNTMLSVSEGSTNPDGVTKTVNGKSLAYSIVEKYAINRGENDIQLRVNYHGYVLTSKTNFTFTKEGQLGTNGTGFVVKIVPCDSDGNPISDYPLATTTNGTSYTFNFNRLYAQLWRNGESVFKIYKSGSGATLVWSILRNKYTASKYDNSCFSIDSEGKVTAANSSASTTAKITTLYNQIVAGTPKSATALDNTPANIIKLALSYDGITYYATMPIITLYKNDAANTDVCNATLTKNTGFRYAIYSDDGRTPQYDNHQPFTFKVTKKINGTVEDISISKVSGNSPSYSFGVVGQYYQDGARKYKTYLGSATAPSGKLKNTYYLRPTDTYDGLCVTNACYSIIKVGNATMFVHVPIHFMLNRYGNAAINAWDGNSVSIDANGNNTILAPQVGAGTKGNDNTFTGIVIGKVKQTNPNKTQNGLFGYSSGVRSIFLDAATGKAEFGKAGAGQIIMNPTDNTAILQSGNYSTTNKTGMQINLTAPSITFGSGHFKVDQNGNITAKGGGTIGGFSISDTYLYSGKTSIDDNKNGVYLGTSGIALGKNNTFRVDNNGTLYSISGNIAGWTIKENSLTKGKVGISSDSSKDTNIAFWAGHTSPTSAKFRVDYSGNANLDGTITARSGYIGDGINGFTISSYAIYNGKSKGFKDATQEGIYLGTAGIGLGKGTFYVSKQGELHATSGDVGGWKLTSNAIRSADDVEYNGKKGMYFGSAGIRLGENFHVSNQGNLYANDGDFEGKIKSGSGEIGGWTINSTNLKAGNITIGSNGAISGGTKNGANWKIENDGTATFTDISITGKNSKWTNGSITGGTISNNRTGGSITGGSIGGSGGSYPSISPDAVKVGNGTLEQWGVKIADGRIEAYEGEFKKLAADQITATNINAAFAKGSLEFAAGHLTSTGNIDLNGHIKNGNLTGATGSVAGISFKGGIVTSIPSSLSGYAKTSDIPSVPSTTSNCYGLTSSTGSVQIDGVTYSVSLPVTIKHNFYIK